MLQEWSWLAAIVIPTAVTASLLIARWAIRRHRGAIVNELTSRLAPEGAEGLPQLDTVRAKYMPGRLEGGSAVPGASRHSFTALILTATLFTLLTIAAAALLVLPVDQLAAGPGGRILLWVGPGGGPDSAAEAMAVTAFAALGAYFAMLLYLQKAVIKYELDAISFARATLMILLGAMIATAVHRAVPLDASIAKSGWAGLAFLIGVSHERVLTFLVRTLDFRYRKAVADLNGSESVPVEIVEGIDSDIAFRLQESNIYDIQNLATANPIQLCVETPYGLFETFDWVLQAQLCLATGRPVFVKLRSHYGIRTAFDLERSVLACGAPEEYVRAIGTVLFSEADPMFAARLKLDGSGEPDVKVIRHAVAVLVDDLHVHRLRSVWRQILKTVSDGKQDRLYGVCPLPGDADYEGCDCVRSPTAKVVGLSRAKSTIRSGEIA